MNYKNPTREGKQPPKTRALRRLWLVQCFDGDPDDPNVGVVEKSCVAWNQPHAIRMCGRVAKLPQHKCFVTWPENEGDPIYEIYDTAGPIDVEVKPTVAIHDSADDWDF
jgi:hypothetical protein